ncbi:interleukin-22 receptor subunit alpha-1 [Mixophyes fleayi]|uniref:interleukin-22 receptor subunit alpha-1 n=1 Tax=Mixophyes fleayi TaxID=3061075 RepID=UPI003F4DB4D1
MKSTFYYLLFSLLSVHICHGCLNFKYHNVTFNATNFEYMLQWNKRNLAPDVSFNVQYKRYGQTEWLLLHECQNITRNYCNLTNAIFNDVEDSNDVDNFMKNQYYGRVSALSSNCSSDWVTSKRLNPRDDTHLILPKLNYVQHVSSITIVIPTLHVPMRSKEGQPMTVEELYRDDLFEYYVSFLNSENNEIWQKAQKEKRFEVSGLNANTEYNGSVYILIGNERKSAIQSFVVKTLPDHSVVILVASLISICAMALCGALLYMSCKYIKQEAEKPSSLDFRKMTSFPLFTSPKDKVISSCTVGVSPAMYVQLNDLRQKICEERTKSSEVVTYARQFQDSTTSTQQDSTTLRTQSMYCLQKNNSTTDSSDQYVRVFKDQTNNNGKYLHNPVPNPCNTISYGTQVAFHADVDHSFLDHDSGTCKGSENKICKFNFSLPLLSQEKNTFLDIIPSLPLMSSVIVSDGFGMLGQMGKEDELAPVLNIHLDGFTNNQREENDFEHSLLGHGGSPYILQCPMENVQADILDNTLICEKPYKVQHPSETYRPT